MDEARAPESMRHEYSEAWNALRHYSNLRFAMLTLFFGVTGGLAAAAFGQAQPLGHATDRLAAMAKCAGIAFTVLFYLVEINIFAKLNDIGQVMTDLERQLRYRLSHHGTRSVSAPRAKYINALIFGLTLAFWAASATRNPVVCADHVVEVRFLLYRLPHDDCPARVIFVQRDAAGQCSKLLSNERHRGVAIVHEDTNTLAVRKMINGGTGKGLRAISTPIAASQFSIEVETRDIEDSQDLRTRFIRVSTGSLSSASRINSSAVILDHGKSNATTDAQDREYAERIRDDLTTGGLDIRVVRTVTGLDERRLTYMEVFDGFPGALSLERAAGSSCRMRFVGTFAVQSRDPFALTT